MESNVYGGECGSVVVVVLVLYGNGPETGVGRERLA